MTSVRAAYAFVAAVKPIWDRFIEKYGDAGVKLALDLRELGQVGGPPFGLALARLGQ